MSSVRETGRIERHRRVRVKVFGTAERPRVVVHRSLAHIHAQAINDDARKTLAGCSSREAEFVKQAPKKGKVTVAEKLGEHFAQVLKKKGVQKIAFDRGGYLYHGRVKAFADALRKGGIQF